MLVQSFDAASQFLARAVPWPMAGEADWYVNIHHNMTLPTGRIVFPGIACTTVKDAVRVVQSFVTKPKRDIYVCMSAQREMVPRVSARGFKWTAAKRGLATAIWHKSLYVDVDVKENAYATPEEAAQEFMRIRAEIGLPLPSIMIASGSGGFHAHWIFIDPIDPQRFDVLAAALVAALLNKGFKGDTGVTIDRSRLLRIPDTFNHKTDPPKPVGVVFNSGNDYQVEVIEQILQPYVGLVTAKVTKPASAFAPIIPAGLVASTKFKASALAGTTLAETPEPVIPLDAVARVCPWVAETVSTGGAANANPLWLASTNLSLFLADSRAAAHTMASGHAKYTVAETDALFDRQQATKASRNLGWPRCATISGQGAPECATCPHLAHGKSPLNFAVIASTPVAPTPLGAAMLHGVLQGVTTPVTAPVTGQVTSPLPEGYSYAVNGSAGIVCKIEQDDAGVQTMHPVYDMPMYNAWLQPNPATLHFDTVDVFGKSKTINVPLKLMGDERGWFGHLADQFFPIHKPQAKGLHMFQSSWIQKLKHDRATTMHSVPFGWLIENGERKGFVYGGNLWSPAGIRPAGKVDRALADDYTPKGDLKPYLDAVAMLVAQQRPEVASLLVVSYASPLVALIGQTGFVMSVYSQESGIQKSTALKVNASVWAHPSRSMQSLSDTHNAVFRKAGQTRHLPIVWDELRTGDDAHKFSDFVFQLSGGKEKARLKATTEFQSMGDWATILVGASNNSLLGEINKANKGTEAGAMRIFEYVIPRATQGIISTADATMMVSALDENYGMAGMLYAKFLGENFDLVRDETMARLKDYEVRYKAKPEERFWFALVACLLQGAEYANQIIGTHFDTYAMESFLLSTLQGMRQSNVDATTNLRDPVNLSEVLSRYLNFQAAEHTLITDNFVPPQSKATTTIRNDILRMKEAQVHLTKLDQHLRIRLTAFTKWLEDQKIPVTIVLDELKVQFGAVRTKQSKLGWGTDRFTLPDQCVTFDLNNPNFPVDWKPY